MVTSPNKYIWTFAFGSRYRLLTTAGIVSVVGFCLLAVISLNDPAPHSVRKYIVPTKHWKVGYDSFSCMSGPWNDCSKGK